MNLLTQKVERAIRSVQLIFWGAVAGLILGAVIGTLVTRYWYTSLARPGPAAGPPAVVINPAPEEARPAEIHLGQTITGTLKGSARLPAKVRKKEAEIEPEAETSSTAEIQEPILPSNALNGSGDLSRIEAGEGNHTSPSPSIEPRASSFVWEGDRIIAPVSGELETVITDARSGEELARAVQPVQGETELEIRDGRLEIETTFTAPMEIAIDLPEEEPARNRIGILYLADGGWGGYYRREWRLARIGGVTAMGWAGIGVLRGNPSVGVGIDISF